MKTYRVSWKASILYHTTVSVPDDATEVDIIDAVAARVDDFNDPDGVVADFEDYAPTYEIEEIKNGKV